MSKPRISIIVGAAENNVIGHKGDMPWKVSADLKNFKKITLGKPIIMGRKTFESIGRPLPGRRNIVITRNPDWKAEGVDVFPSLEAAIEATSDSEEVMIIGGGELYKIAMPMADRVYLTRIHANPQGDTWFPELPETIWKTTETSPIPGSEKDTASASFMVLERQ
ncbi:MAG: diacylglycerol kinase [Hyphomicrobiales bacterium]|nr:MAG: diacylglycerol kinase [Hyphomicrobiales bacterium]